MVQTFTRKRVEILVDSPLAPLVIKAAANAGIAGYTLIPVQSGAGRGGSWRRGDVSDAASKTIFLTIASAENAGRLVDSLAPHLESYGMLLTLSDVEVVRPERF